MGNDYWSKEKIIVQEYNNTVNSIAIRAAFGNPIYLIDRIKTRLVEEGGSRFMSGDCRAKLNGYKNWK